MKSCFMQIEMQKKHTRKKNVSLCRWIILTFISFSLPKIHSPTFKTITPTSRTQLKTLLQREQLLQEAERKKENERKLLEREQQKQKQKLESQKVPLQVDVPPQVLQVSRLSHINPQVKFQWLINQSKFPAQIRFEPNWQIPRNTMWYRSKRIRSKNT